MSQNRWQSFLFAYVSLAVANRILIYRQAKHQSSDFFAVFFACVFV